MIGEIRQNFTEASASVGLILATALVRGMGIFVIYFYFPQNSKNEITSSLTDSWKIVVVLDPAAFIHIHPPSLNVAFKIYILIIYYDRD